MMSRKIIIFISLFIILSGCSKQQLDLEIDLARTEITLECGFSGTPLYDGNAVTRNLFNPLSQENIKSYKGEISYMLLPITTIKNNKLPEFTADIEVLQTQLGQLKDGRAYLVYRVASGDSYQEKIQIINIVDNVEPQITLKQDRIEVERGANIDFLSQIENVYDACHGKFDISKVYVMDKVDTSKPGEYDVRYFASEDDKEDYWYPNYVVGDYEEELDKIPQFKILKVVVK